MAIRRDGRGDQNEGEQRAETQGDRGSVCLLAKPRRTAARGEEKKRADMDEGWASAAELRQSRGYVFPLTPLGFYRRTQIPAAAGGRTLPGRVPLGRVGGADAAVVRRWAGRPHRPVACAGRAVRRSPPSVRRHAGRHRSRTPRDAARCRPGAGARRGRPRPRVDRGSARRRCRGLARTVPRRASRRTRSWQRAG